MRLRSPKIFYQEIQFHPAYSLDTDGRFGNNKTFFLSTDNLFLLAVLNSPLMWWHNWRYLPHMKDEALTPVAFRMEELPIAEPTTSIREAAETTVRRLIELTSRQQQTQRTLLDWLRVEYGIEKPSNKLLALTELDSDTWVSEVKRIRGKKQPLSSAGLHALRDEYTRTIDPARALAAESLDPGAHPQRPRQPGLRPDPGGDRPNVANRPAPHAHPAAWNRMSGRPRMKHG